jgi:AcrR family transcriptional regulator/DNA-binding MarR family transcriptional regulator
MAAVAHPPSGRSREREGAHVQEMHRRLLLWALREVSGEVGLANATVGQVCKRSRMSRRTFYELFEDRDDCFLATFEQALEQIAERVLSVWEAPAQDGVLEGTSKQSGPWQDRVRSSLQAVLGLFDEQPQLARLCIVETLTGGPVVLARRREILKELAGVVDEGRREARAAPKRRHATDPAGGPPPLTAEGTVGGVLAVIHARLLAPRDGGQDPDSAPLADLVPSLVSMIVFPYLGPAAAQRELTRTETCATRLRSEDGTNNNPTLTDPFRDLPLRFTYRTARVLATIASHPGASNRHIGEGAGMTDQGKTSTRLKRLEGAGLIENAGPGRDSGEPNAWQLTPRGREIDTALGTHAG